MKTTAFAILILAGAALASGCAPQTTTTAGDMGNPYGTGMPPTGMPPASGGNPYGYGNNPSANYGSGNYTPADLNNPNSILAQRVIYFDFDSSNIRPEYINVLNAHAALLATHPHLRVRLEGHADERGSREYNVALSERRGYAVFDYLQLKNVRANQMEVIGYGEEVPAVFGSNEAAWGKNRRVEIKYAGE